MVERLRAPWPRTGVDMAWSLQPGDRRTRADLSSTYGGSPQGGIAPCTKSPNILLYSDPERGSTYGYDYDGWDEDREVFHYTGEGRQGDQRLDRGNKALLEHEQDGRAVRLFLADGVAPRGRAKLHRYVGEFTTAKSPPFTLEEAPDLDGALRQVFVFRLAPMGAHVLATVDAPTRADLSQVNEVELLGPEAHDVREGDRDATEPSTFRRTESDLVVAYEAHLDSLEHTHGRYRLRPAGQLRSLRTDVINTTTNELIEAKGRTTRSALREAIGQLFDYRRFIASEPSLAVLFPSEPPADFVSLLHELGIAAVHQDLSGGFVRQDPEE